MAVQLEIATTVLLEALIFAGVFVLEGILFCFECKYNA